MDGLFIASSPWPGLWVGSPGLLRAWLVTIACRFAPACCLPMAMSAACTTSWICCGTFANRVLMVSVHVITSSTYPLFAVFPTLCRLMGSQAGLWLEGVHVRKRRFMGSRYVHSCVLCQHVVMTKKLLLDLVCLIPIISCSISRSSASKASRNRHFSPCILHLIMNLSTDSDAVWQNFCRLNLLSRKLAFGSMRALNLPQMTSTFLLSESDRSHVLYMRNPSWPTHNKI